MTISGIQIYFYRLLIWNYLWHFVFLCQWMFKVQLLSCEGPKIVDKYYQKGQGNNSSIKLHQKTRVIFLPVRNRIFLTLLDTVQNWRSEVIPCNSIKICRILQGSTDNISWCSNWPMLTLAEAKKGRRDFYFNNDLIQRYT